MGTDDIAVAFIAAVALVLAALVAAVPAIITSRTNRDRIGKPNGKGNVIEMVEQALDKADRAETLAGDAVETVEKHHKMMNRRLNKQDDALQRIELAVRAVAMDQGIPEIGSPPD